MIPATTLLYTKQYLDLFPIFSNSTWIPLNMHMK
jgi:hypothetical protein